MHNNQKEGFFGPSHSVGAASPTPFALVYADLPQPETLSPNQWISLPKTGGVWEEGEKGKRDNQQRT